MVVKITSLSSSTKRCFVLANFASTLDIYIRASLCNDSHENGCAIMSVGFIMLCKKTQTSVSLKRIYKGDHY